jgi:hypothetical protein
MEPDFINSFESLIIKLRKFFRLNQATLKLSKEEEQIKKDLETQIIEFLNDFQTHATYEDEKKPNYSLDMLANFFNIGSVPLMTKKEEAEAFKSQGFINKLDELMKKKGVKSKEVIEATGINQSVFSKAKVGIREPSKELLETLSTYFKYDFMQYL